MKKNILISACILIALLSCNKNEVTPGKTENNHKNMVKTESYVYHPTETTYMYTYTYNENNLIERLDIDDGTSLYITFAYSHNMIVEQNYDQNGIPRETDTLYLDGIGLVVSYHWIDHIIQYTYDNDGYRISEVNNRGNDILESFTGTIKNGNCVKMLHVYYKEKDSELQELSFNLDKNNSVTWDHKGQPYYGKSDVDIIDHIDYQGCAGIYRTDTYSYVYNQDGLVGQINISTPVQDYSINYTYY
jgi:YD repeat-containing protein